LHEEMAGASFAATGEANEFTVAALIQRLADEGVLDGGAALMGEAKSKRSTRTNKE